MVSGIAKAIGSAPLIILLVGIPLTHAPKAKPIRASSC